MEAESTPPPKYLILRTKPIGGESGDASKIVSYGSVKTTNLQDSNPNEVFRVYSNVSETERLFRSNEGGVVQYIKLVRQPAMELATLPPPRSNTLYLITEYEKIQSPLFTLFADKKITICTDKSSDFRSIKSKLNSMERAYNTTLNGDNRRGILDTIYTATLKGESYAVLDAANDNDVPKPRILTRLGTDINTVDDLLKQLGEKSPEWIVILDIDNHISNSMFNSTGFSITSETLSLDPAPAASAPSAPAPAPEAPAPAVETETGSSSPSAPATAEAKTGSSSPAPSAPAPASAASAPEASEPAPAEETADASTT